MRSYLVFLLLALLAPQIARAAVPTWRSAVTLPDDPASIGPVDHFAIAEQLGDPVAVAAALEREDWPEHLREWAAARWAWRQGQSADALQAFDHAAATWPADSGEPPIVLELFDQQRLELALAADDLDRADAAVRTPLRPHHDAVWRALRARVEAGRGRSVEAAQRMARAWEQADESERRHPAFLHAAAAYLAVGDTLDAVDAWQKCVARIRRPERLRAAVQVWDAHPALRAAVARADDPSPTLTFLARALRREESIELVAGRIDAGLGDAAAQQLFIAEQYYRLRDHEALLAWLEEVDRSDFDPELQARAEAYQWGMARRSGSSVDVARGFDTVAATWPDTDRAAEAWWESAWMYELSDDTSSARDRYERHVAATGQGRFRSSAALRTILLPWRAGDHDAAAEAFRAHEAALGDGMDQAAAWWLMSRIPGASGELAARLRTEHPASPFWRGVQPRLEADALPGPEALAATQAAAFARVGEALGTGDPLQELPEELLAVARIAELGLRAEATVRLDAWARARHRDDAARLRVVAVAWAHGLAEMQGRHAWFLERRLRGDDPELDAALRVVSLPTPYAGTVRGIALEHGMPPAVIWALMRRESFFDADVVSLAGAYGLMQLLPKTARRVASRSGAPEPSEVDLFVPAVNLRLGAEYLAGLRQEASGNWIRALASYNAGETNGERWESRLDPGEEPALGILVISYTETRSYVYNVLRVAHLYEDVWRPLP